MLNITSGNGWVDPKIQYGAYAEFAYKNNLINGVTYDLLTPVYEACKYAIETGVWELAIIPCNTIVETILAEAGNINVSLNGENNNNFQVYDIRKQCTYPPLCYDLSAAAKFLNVIKSLTFLTEFSNQVSALSWEFLPTCSGPHVIMLYIQIYLVIG